MIVKKAVLSKVIISEALSSASVSHTGAHQVYLNICSALLGTSQHPEVPVGLAVRAADGGVLAGVLALTGHRVHDAVGRVPGRNPSGRFPRGGRRRGASGWILGLTSLVLRVVASQGI